MRIFVIFEGINLFKFIISPHVDSRICIYLNFLSQTLEQCANANDTSLPLSLCVNRMVNAHSFYDVTNL